MLMLCHKESGLKAKKLPFILYQAGIGNNSNVKKIPRQNKNNKGEKHGISSINHHRM